MKKTLKVLSLALVFVMMLCFIGCGSKETDPTDATKKAKNIGSGENNFYLIILDDDGVVKKAYQVFSDEVMLSNALYMNELIETKEASDGSEYLYTLDGIKADMEKDKKVWTFTIDNTPANANIFETPIQCNSIYAFRLSDIA